MLSPMIGNKASRMVASWFSIAVCAINEDDRKIWQGKCLSTPDAIGALIEEHAPNVAKIGLETRLPYCSRNSSSSYRKNR